MNRIKLSKDEALTLLLYCPELEIMCKEYGDDEDWVGVTRDDVEDLIRDEYQTFEIWGE